MVGTVPFLDTFLLYTCNRIFYSIRNVQELFANQEYGPISFSRFWRVFWGVLPPSTDINSKASGLTGSGVAFFSGVDFSQI